MTPTQVLGYAIAVIGILGMALVGRRRASGWLLLLGTQVGLLLIVTLGQGQPGLILLFGAYAVVYAANWLTWRRRPH